jgi:hypothetical protein
MNFAPDETEVRALGDVTCNYDGILSSGPETSNLPKGKESVQGCPRTRKSAIDNLLLCVLLIFCWLQASMLDSYTHWRSWMILGRDSTSSVKLSLRCCLLRSCTCCMAPFHRPRAAPWPAALAALSVVRPVWTCSNPPLIGFAFSCMHVCRDMVCQPVSLVGEQKVTWGLHVATGLS